METHVSATKAPVTPGMRGFFKRIRAVRRNYAEAFLSYQREFGDRVYFPFPREVFLFFHPDAVKHILKDHHANFRKSDFFMELKPLLGEGLLTSEGEPWKFQRRLIAPEFQFQNLQRFVPTMVKASEELIERWRKSSGPRDLSLDMNWLTLKIAGETMFGSHVDSYTSIVAEALYSSADLAVKRMLAFVKIPRSFPTPTNLRGKKAIERLNALVEKIISERKKGATGEAPDLLTRLLRARDSETGNQMSETVLRDEVMTLLLAGYETTSNTLSWSWYLLMKNPDIFMDLKDELNRVLGGRAPGYDDLAKLPLNRMVILESIRLYPPAPILSRHTIEADVIDGVPVGANILVETSPFVVHRHPEFWSSPEKFDPKRFSPVNQKNMHPFQYFPFGGGPRECVGKNFAMIEAQIVLATLAQHVSMKLVDSQRVETDPKITLRPKNGIWVTLVVD